MFCFSPVPPASSIDLSQDTDGEDDEILFQVHATSSSKASRRSSLESADECELNQIREANSHPISGGGHAFSQSEPGRHSTQDQPIEIPLASVEESTDAESARQPQNTHDPGGDQGQQPPPPSQVVDDECSVTETVGTVSEFAPTFDSKTDISLLDFNFYATTQEPMTPKWLGEHQEVRSKGSSSSPGGHLMVPNAGGASSGRRAKEGGVDNSARFGTQKLTWSPNVHVNNDKRYSFSQLMQ